MKHFTTYWRNTTWHYNRLNNDTVLLDHTASNVFKNNLSSGDALYIVTIEKGKLYVACKIIVDEICDQNRAVSLLHSADLWIAKDHIIASASTRLNWNFCVPDHVASQLRFTNPLGLESSKLTYRSTGLLDGQTLRGTRNLTPESASLLDTLLGELEPIELNSQSLWMADDAGESIENELESGEEGEMSKRYITYYERDKKNREMALQIHGYSCKACDLNFEATYGLHGRNFIHVHHLVPVSRLERPRKIDVAHELTVLCPNCHAMVHRQRHRTLTIDELKQLLYDNKLRTT